MVDGWRNRQRGTEPARPGLRSQGSRAQVHWATVRGHGEEGRRNIGEPGVSGPAPGPRGLRLHLVMIPPGTRCLPHFHAGAGSAIFVMSGEADLWHGAGLAARRAVRAGDFIYMPPGTPHLAVNHGEVTSIAVVTRTDPADRAGPVVIELPRHLAGLLSYPVTVSE